MRRRFAVMRRAAAGGGTKRAGVLDVLGVAGSAAAVVWLAESILKLLFYRADIVRRMRGEYARAMTRRITLDEFRQRSQAFFAGATQDLVVIEQDGEVLGALVSPEDYESLRRVRAQRAMDAMNALGKHMASAASPEELEDLVRELDTHNA
jgi:hypothetical protein